MGSGKSTHGKKLASINRQKFFDLDSYIQKKENKTVQFIFDNEGEEQFRELESKYLKELIAEPGGLVISLGGGTVCFNNNLKFIKENGVLIYIEMPAEELATRLKKSRQSRPLLKNVEAKDLPSFIERKLEERNKHYKAAHITVNGIEFNHLQLQQQINEFVKAHK
jgi:shikimate kinase